MLTRGSYIVLLCDTDQDHRTPPLLLKPFLGHRNAREANRFRVWRRRTWEAGHHNHHPQAVQTAIRSLSTESSPEVSWFGLKGPWVSIGDGMMESSARCAKVVVLLDLFTGDMR
jgi:hypothetical protein